MANRQQRAISMAAIVAAAMGGIGPGTGPGIAIPGLIQGSFAPIGCQKGHLAALRQGENRRKMAEFCGSCAAVK